MQEKSISNRNISKKKSENIKIPTKIHEKMKENSNNILPSYKYNCNNNYSNNNSILINKSNVKIDIGNSYKGTNLRSISHSTKCMMKIQTREKDKDRDINVDKDKYQPKISSKNKNKYSAKKNYISTNKYKYHYSNNIKDIKGDKSNKSNKSNKSKRHKNTEDIFIYKSHNSDLNNHSFNYLKNYHNSNSSLKNIESSCFNNYYNFNKNNNKIQKINKNEDNINYYNYNNSKNGYKNNFILPFYYCIKKGDKKYNYLVGS